MRYVLDTNILIHLLRNSSTWKYVHNTYAPFTKDTRTFISFASVAEILSIAKQANWGHRKREHLIELLNELEIIAVSGQVSDLLMQSYVEIDSFSQGKNVAFSLPQGVSARNMGKNDIWIAATAYALNASLISTDKDFIHLDKVLLNVILVEI